MYKTHISIWNLNIYNDQNYTTKRKTQQAKFSFVYRIKLQFRELYAKSFFSYVFLDRHVFSSCNKTVHLEVLKALYN